eukprot:403366170
MDILFIFPVQKFWPGVESTYVNLMCRSNSLQILASVDDFLKVYQSKFAKAEGKQDTTVNPVLEDNFLNVQNIWNGTELAAVKPWELKKKSAQIIDISEKSDKVSTTSSVKLFKEWGVGPTLLDKRDLFGKYASTGELYFSQETSISKTLKIHDKSMATAFIYQSMICLNCKDNNEVWILSVLQTFIQVLVMILNRKLVTLYPKYLLLALLGPFIKNVNKSSRSCYLRISKATKG